MNCFSVKIFVGVDLDLREGVYAGILCNVSVIRNSCVLG